jgi:hypothetical protein
VFAKAMNLEAGGYEVALGPIDGSTIVAPPSLMVRHRQTGRTVRMPMTSSGFGLVGRYRVDQPGDYDLSLIGGEPAALAKARLRSVP